MVHRWMREERQGQVLAVDAGGFVPLTIAPLEAAADACRPTLPAPSSPDPDPGIRIEIQRGGTRVIVQWPLSAATQCARLLSEWIR